MKTFALILVLLLFVRFSAADTPLDSSRPYLDRLLKKDHAKFDDYVFPFLISQTAVRLPFDRKTALARLNAELEKSALPYRGHFSKSGIVLNASSENLFTLPKLVVAGDQLKGIQDCAAKYCKMKLNIEHEKTEMGAANDKVAEYRKLILERLKRYLALNELWGYEGTFQNQDSVSAMIQVLPFMAHDYPVSSLFLTKEFWQKKPPMKAGPVGSMLREELVNMNLEPLQPILRVVEDLHFQEQNRDLFFEIHIYTNHYFDASCRVYEIFPWERDQNQSVLILTDVMNIDELSKSSFVRALYKGKMENAVSDYQDSEISQIQGG